MRLNTLLIKTKTTSLTHKTPSSMDTRLYNPVVAHMTAFYDITILGMLYEDLMWYRTASAPTH